MFCIVSDCPQGKSSRRSEPISYAYSFRLVPGYSGAAINGRSAACGSQEEAQAWPLVLGGRGDHHRGRFEQLGRRLLEFLERFIGYAAVLVEFTGFLGIELSDKAEAAPKKTFGDILNTAFGTFDAVTKSGKGGSVIDLPAGAKGAIVTATNTGSGNFAIWTLDANNTETDLLVNEIGNYSGITFFGQSDPVKLKITAGGNWSVTVAPVSSAAALPASGRGDSVYIYSGKAANWAISHSGKSNFAIHYLSETTEDLLVNEIGNYSGTIPVKSGPAVVIITADGDWSIANQ